MAYLCCKPGSPFWYVVYIDGIPEGNHRFTKLRADYPNETIEAKGSAQSWKPPSFAKVTRIAA